MTTDISPNRYQGRHLKNMFKISIHTRDRILEIIPGTTVWLTLLLAIILSIFKPLWLIYFIIVFSLYWILRIFYLNIHIIYSWWQLRQDLKIDWPAKLRQLPGWDGYYHLVILPTYKEPLEVIETCFEGLIKNTHPLDKFIVVLGGEEGDQEAFLQRAEIIKNKYGDKFFKFLITVHPKGLPGEIPGKGSNAAWMGEHANVLIDELAIPYKKIIVSNFDIDTVAHPYYFSCLTYKYIIHPDPTHTSFQPIAFYHNNIWDAPMILRIVANSTTFWLLSDLARPERMFTFSSHSMSFKALVDVGFWSKNLVTEDSHIFVQCFVHYRGNYSVEPIFVPVSMDTVLDESLWRSLKNQYKQVRRWGWTVEQWPFMVVEFFSKRGRVIPFWKKIKPFLNFTEGEYSWPTAPILLFTLGYLPFIWADTFTKTQVITQNAPYVLQNIMTVGMLGIILLAVMSTAILPPAPKGQKYRYLFMILQWILLPISMIIFGSLPALEAQTRLLLGGKFKLGFNVTPKVRKTTTDSTTNSMAQETVTENPVKNSEKISLKK